MHNELNKKVEYFISYLTVVLIALLVWEIVSYYTKHMIPSPMTSIEWLVSEESVQSIIWNTSITLRNSLTGFGVALILSALTAMFSRLGKTANMLVEAFNVIVQSISALIWILVFLILFGFRSPIPPIMVTSGVAYPILLSSLLGGMRSIDTKIVELSELLGASKYQLFRHVYFPALVPFAVAGSRAALGTALRISVVAEAFGSSGGIGYKLNYYFDLYCYEGMLAWALLLIVLMIAVDKLVLNPAEEWSKRWLP